MKKGGNGLKFGQLKFYLADMPTLRPPTLREIAEYVGYSKSAVSLALRDDLRMAEATRREIQEKAAALGYRKNAVLAHLMAELRNSRIGPTQATLAMVNCAPETTIFEWHTFRDFREGARLRAAKFGYAMQDFWLFEPGMKPARLRQIFHARNLAGMVLIGAQNLAVFQNSYHDLWRHLPVSTAGLVRTEPPLACVACDHFQTAYWAVRAGLERGYRRPAMVLDEALDELTDHRFSGGFFAATSGLPASRHIPIFYSDRRNGRVFADWYRKHEPDFIVTLHTEVRNWLEGLGVAIPGTTAVAHLDWYPGMRGWAGMKQDNLSTGACVVDLVVTQIHSNEKGAQVTPMVTLVESRWVAGDTVRETIRTGETNRGPAVAQSGRAGARRV